MCDVITANGATPRVTITLESAHLGIAQSNGEAWDSTEHVAGRLISVLMSILSATREPTAQFISQLIGFLDGSDFAHYDKPDSAGYAELFLNGSWSMRLSFIGDEDSFTPQWRPLAGTSFGTGGTRWIGVTLSPAFQIRVVLRERDTFGADDPMGTFVLTYDDVCRALEPPGGVTHTRVDAMTYNQTILFGISVARQ